MAAHRKLCPNPLLAPGLLVFLVLWLGTPAFAQLPPESALPNEVRPSATTLPGEAVLADPQASPLTTPAKLPDESVLADPARDPASANGNPGDAAAQAQTDLSPGRLRPWLRLNYSGHTGIVRQLAIDETGTWLVSAGEDKDVHVWTRLAGGQGPWVHRRTLRWQVERGPRGRIHALALRGNQLALAGYGAMGQVGEIWIMDISTGDLRRTLVDVDQGHQQTVVSLAWAPGSIERLASADKEGKVLVWEPDRATGLWSAKIVADTDQRQFGAQTAASLESMRGFLPIRFLNADQLLLPTYAGTDNEGFALWQVALADIPTRGLQRFDQAIHQDAIVALAVADDGSRWASSDLLGNVWLWSRDRSGRNELRAQALEAPQAMPLDLRFTRDGSRLLIGTAQTQQADGTIGPAMIELWDSRTGSVPKLMSSFNVPEELFAVVPDPVRPATIAATGHKVIVVPWNEANQFDAQASQQLAPPIAMIHQLAFAKEPPLYRLAMSRDEQGPLTQAFDLEQLQLSRDPIYPADQWPTTFGEVDGWSVREINTDQDSGYWVFKGEVQQAKLPLRPEYDGAVSAIAWLPVAAPAPPLLIVGTTGNANIYVLRITNDAGLEVVRQYRGHAGAVTALSISQDRRYLASASTDSTVAIWKIESVTTMDSVRQRWGLELEVMRIG